MRLRNRYSISIVAVLAALIPVGTMAADSPALRSPLIVVGGAGPDTVRVSGTVSGTRQLQALLYATFAQDLPGVFLNRRSLATGADGHFDATIPIAPAYFSGAIITVIVQTTSAVQLGRGSMIITDPNDRTPASH